MPVLLESCHLTEELIKRKNSTTPDFLERKLERHIPVFIYDDMKSGMKNHSMMDGTIWLGDAYTTTQGYVMERSEIDTPVVFDSGGLSSAAHRIYGEVYVIDAMKLLEIDRMNANNEMFSREMKFVCLLEQTVKPGIKLRPSLKCWMYLGLDNFWVTTATKSMQSKEIGTQRCFTWDRTPSDYYRPFNPTVHAPMFI